MKKKLMTALLLGWATMGWGVPQQFTLTSPKGDYTFTFFHDDSQGHTEMSYSLSFRGQEIIQRSSLGVDIKNKLLENALGIVPDTCKRWTDNLTLLGEERTQHNATWKPLYGENATVSDHYKALRVKYRKGDVPNQQASDGYDRSRTYFLDIEVRAYDQGVALRYHFPQTTNGLFLHITRERTEFCMPKGTMAYYEPWAQSHITKLPLEGWDEETERPLTMELPSGLTVSLGEAAMVDYVRTKFALSETKAHTLQTAMYDCADVITPYSTPWRVIMAAQKPVELIANNCIYLNLNRPNMLKGDLSWIKPGKAFRTGLKQQEAMEAVDFAAERGLQYIHLDAGWYGPEMDMASDASRVIATKDVDFKALCDYAATKGIGVWAYVNQRALVQQIDSLLPIYKQWGLKGIKFGFVQIGNQNWTIWLHKAVKKCADYGLMVDIHDEYRPTGVSRTLPHLMTQEGIAGNEVMPDAKHNVTLPFTRFLCGPGDYTPCYFNSRVKNTHCHQLAMPVVYYSPITFLYWYDGPALYKGEKELDFWKHVPTVWDETYPIDGRPGEFVAIARRSGKTWFVGVMNGLDQREVKLATDFLQPRQKYRVTLYEDDPKLNTRTQVAISQKTIRGGDKLKLDLLASGGAAIEIEPVK